MFRYRQERLTVDHDRTYPSPTMANSGSDDSQRRPRNKAPLLATLAVLMVATIVGTSYLVLLQLRTPDTVKTANAHAPTPTTSAALPALTPTPDLSLPTNNGWTAITEASNGDVQFAAGDPQKGFLCGTQGSGTQHVFGVTVDGGKTWSIGKSPASYMTCYLQISPSNPLDLTLTSVNAPGDGADAFVEAHYSTNGGQSWKAAPIPQNTIGVGQLLWSGPYLYLLARNTLEVSANGGPFSQIAISAIAPAARQVTLTSEVATANRLYLNVQTNACQSPCAILLASSNGGASWAKVPNNGNVLLEQVQGNTLYGGVMNGDPSLTSIMRSSDGGASWDTISFPPLPSGLGINSYVVAPDQTIFVSTRGEVAALHSGTWKVYPFSVSENDVYMDSIEMTTISFDRSARPLKIWGHDEGQHPGIYWHSV